VKNTPGKLNHVMVQDQHQKSCAAAKREPARTSYTTHYTTLPERSDTKTKGTQQNNY